MKQVCKVCNYLHEGPKALGSCPVCKAPKNKFEEMARYSRSFEGLLKRYFG